MIRDAEVERVILAIPELDEATLARVVSACRALGVKLSVMPPMRAMLGTAVQLTHIAEMPVIEYGTWDDDVLHDGLQARDRHRGLGRGLVLLAPVMLVIAAGPPGLKGPALFSQLRAGRHGKPFKMLKFRTMCHDAEARISEVVAVRASRSRCTSCVRTRGSRVWAECCVARASTSCRSSSTSCAGDMSLVGPRPEEVWLVNRYSETERFRLEMRPGSRGPCRSTGAVS